MSEPDYFGEYHRVGTRMLVTRVVATIAVAACIVAGVTALAAGAPPAPIQSQTLEEPAPTASPSDTAVPVAAVADVLPSPDATVAASPTPSPAPSLDAQGANSWTIAIDTTGYQAEIDDCLWVRMDLGLDAPIVGAHNYCGGGVVLDMAIGDTVVLTGTGLDGTYRVTEERLANAGDNAAAATEGLQATVILQTCFWANDGTERLLALLPA